MKLNFSPKNTGGHSGNLPDSDHEILEQIEKKIREGNDDRDEMRKEMEQRRSEMERLRNFVESQPASAPSTGHAKPSVSSKANSAENDPRYREYFERLKREKQKSQGGNVASGVGVATPPAGSTFATGNIPDLKTGTIIRLDDGSVAIYKDAVSGKDYALLYFLDPDGQTSPRGVFLGQYQIQVLGSLPEDLMGEFVEGGQWNRDAAVFHMDRWESVGYLDNLAPHQERRPPARPKQSMSASNPVAPLSANPTPVSSNSIPAESSSPTPSRGTDSSESGSANPTPTSGNTLEKGRVFKIIFNGKSWEAVYWTSDEKGAIVAHDTHGAWSLIHLDLNRFKDGMEFGALLTPEQIAAVEMSLLQEHG